MALSPRIDGIPLLVSRTGRSSELGYEIHLRNSADGDALWERIMAAEMAFGLKPGHTSSIRRIEAGCCHTMRMRISRRIPTSWGSTALSTWT
ncbi:hypothetical protein ACOI1H_23365 [Loktanella sp. DJP18]|uniref:hypothetical protein n=1 Tax=Loktanella sp. DJP18 TaxID=3409788 RepID=UPI003BB718A8